MAVNKVFIFIFFLLLAACSSPKIYAPVVNGWQESKVQTSDYCVQEDDTVYSIAWAYGMDYRDIAKMNHLLAPYTIHVGQKLKMSRIAQKHSVLPAKSQSKSKMSKAPSKKTTPMTAVTHEVMNKNWAWPTQGKLVKTFSSSNRNYGIDVTGQLAQPIVAAASGKVVYAGGGLRGYGKLIIIKHNNSYLSAYAFNKTLLVKEGSSVKIGQKIADMGKDDSGRNLLHFEIRRDGKPVDPMLYLPRA